MQSVHPGGTIVGSHDDSQEPRPARDRFAGRVGDLYILLLDGSRLVVALLGKLVGRLKARPFGVPAAAAVVAARASVAAFLERLAKFLLQGILLVPELVDQITGIAPKREFRARRAV